MQYNSGLIVLGLAMAALGVLYYGFVLSKKRENDSKVELIEIPKPDINLWLNEYWKKDATFLEPIGNVPDDLNRLGAMLNEQKEKRDA